MRTNTNQQPTDAYLGMLDLIISGHDPTREQIITLKEHDPVVRVAVNAAVAALIEYLKMELELRKAREQEEQERNTPP